MSSVRSKRPVPSADALALLDAGREWSTSAVFLHAAVASRLRLSVTDLKALDLLQRLGPLSAGELRAHTGLASGSVTSLIDRLETKRFVRRDADRRDGRRVVVALTPELGRRIAPLFDSLAQKMLTRNARYRPRDVALLRDFLREGAADMRDEAAKLLARGARRRT